MGLTTLCMLNMAHNALGSDQLPKDLFLDFPRLIQLRLDHNQIQNLPSTWLNSYDGTHLSLDLSENKITQLPKNLLHTLTKLSSLQIGTNTVVHLDLGLSHNALEGVPSGLFNQTTNLRSLSVVKCVNGTYLSLDLSLEPDRHLSEPLRIDQFDSLGYGWLAFGRLQDPPD